MAYTAAKTDIKGCCIDSTEAMEILDAFVLNGVNHNISILWKDSKPLFRAKEIGDVLGLTNVHMSIGKFPNSHKALNICHTQSGPQEVMFLTESGVYRLLMRSRKPIAEPFQEWVCDVICKIREKGYYDLAKAVKEKDEEMAQALKDKDYTLKQKDEDILKNKERFDLLVKVNKQLKHQTDKAHQEYLLDTYDKKNVIYFARIGEIEDGEMLVKIGATDDIQNRIFGLYRDYGKEIFITHVFDAIYNKKEGDD